MRGRAIPAGLVALASISVVAPVPAAAQHALLESGVDLRLVWSAVPEEPPPLTLQEGPTDLSFSASRLCEERRTEFIVAAGVVVAGVVYVAGRVGTFGPAGDRPDFWKGAVAFGALTSGGVALYCHVVGGRRDTLGPTTRKGIQWRPAG